MAKSGSSEAKKVGLIVMDVDHAYFHEMQKGLEATLEKAGIPYEMILVTFDAVTHVEALKKLAASGCSLIVATLANEPSVIREIAGLKAKGIPVIALHSDVPTSERIAYIGADSYKTGTIAAGVIGRLFSGESRAEIAIITGNEQFYAHTERVRGAKDYLQKSFRNIVIDAVAAVADNDYRCYEDIQKLLAEFPGIKGFIFTAGGVYGGCKALFQLTTRMKFNVVTFAEIPTTLDFMEKGVIDMTIVEDGEKQGIYAAELAEKVLAGEEIPEFNYLASTLKTKECL